MTLSPARYWHVPLLLIVLGLLLLLVSCVAGEDQGQAQPTPTPLPTAVVPEKPTYTVQRGDVVRSVTLTGRVSAVAEERLFFRSDGFVDAVHVTLGDEVQAGQLLAELNSGDLAGQLAQAELALRRAQTILQRAEQEHEQAVIEGQLALQQAKTRLQQAQAGVSSASVTSAEVGLTRAQEQVAYWQYEVQKALDRPWEPQEVKDNYARQLKEAERNLEIAQAQYDAAVGDRSAGYHTVQLQEYEVRAAELALEQLQRGVDPLLALDVEQAQLDVSRLQEQLAATQLVAPFDGRVTSLTARPSDAVSAYEPLAIVADPSALELTVDAGSDVVRELGVSMPATVRLSQRPEQPLRGEIRQLPGAFGSSLEEAQDRFVHITLPDTAELTLGELASATIVLQEKESVLWLPPAALRSFQGRQFVVVQDNPTPRRLDVRTGIEGDGRLEIVEGVEEGQVVIGE